MIHREIVEAGRCSDYMDLATPAPTVVIRDRLIGFHMGRAEFDKLRAVGWNFDPDPGRSFFHNIKGEGKQPRGGINGSEEDARLDRPVHSGKPSLGIQAGSLCVKGRVAARRFNLEMGACRAPYSYRETLARNLNAAHR